MHFPTICRYRDDIEFTGRVLVGTPWGEPDIPFVLIVLTVFFTFFSKSPCISRKGGVRTAVPRASH